MIITTILAIDILLILIDFISCIKRREYNFSIVLCMLSVLVCNFSCIAMVWIDSQRYLYIAFNLFYIVYGWLIFGVSCFLYDNHLRKKLKFYMNPVFYLSIIQSSIILKQFMQQSIYKLTMGDFGGFSFWCATQYDVQFYICKTALWLAWLITIVMAILALNKIPTVYKNKIYILIFIHAVFLTIELLSSFNVCPVWVSALIMAPACMLSRYLGTSYDEIKLKNWALTMMAENLSGGLVLYSPEGKMVYINNILEDLLSPEQRLEFIKKEKFESYIEDRVTIDDIEVKKIETGENEHKYFEVRCHEFKERNLEVGLAYTLTDITGSINCILSLEKNNEELAQDSKMKSDYLANMSHEIRTPMNAVIGMAEMALREQLPVGAQEYIKQIKASGRNLLSIVNDILDYSKIEAGKLSILPDIYDLLPEIRDVARAMAPKIGEKDVELMFDVNPKIPGRLEGDMMRIRQVLFNVTENAIKFTEHGQIKVRVDFYKKNEENEIVLSFRVSDTGIGIHEKDIGKLFESFKQLDTKKNRAVEGTGLGLAISKDMLEAMGGSISVTSEYGLGSEFYFEVPQKVVDDTPVIDIESLEKKHVYGLLVNDYLEDCVRTSTLKLKAGYTSLEGIENLALVVSDAGLDDRRRASQKYLLVDEKLYNDRVRRFLIDNPECTGIVILDEMSEFKPDIEGLKSIKKPFNSLVLGLIMSNKDMAISKENEEKAFSTNFVAVGARVLIVDDNSINITVAEGLLQLLGMKIYTALSGEQAIEMVRERQFDIIFMDHMMPGMDGVETTEYIRKNVRSAANTPIIALTANAVAGAKEMFLKAGMNDYIPKPIEMNVIAEAVRRWLPEEKIMEKTSDSSGVVNREVEIPGLNTKAAIGRIGSADLYMKITADYFKKIHSFMAEIQQCFDTENWTDYTIKIHALKSSSRQIGADELADAAQELERAGHEKDYEYILNNASRAIELYKEVQQILSEVFGDTEVDQSALVPITKEVLTGELERLKAACEELDMDVMESVEAELKKYSYDESQKELVDELCVAIEGMDTDECIRIAGEFNLI